jgi:outer membrane protein, multidrug efflux system
LLRATSESYRATLALVERRRRAGYASDLDLARMRAEAAAVDADALALDRRRAELEHALAFLAGTTAVDVPSSDGAHSNALPTVPVGLPSAMLARRPDVLAAERSVEAARLRLGVAQTAWVPTFTLTGTSGYASNDVADLLRSTARTWGIAGLVAATIFDGGARRAGIEAADADLALAADTYHERLLGALRDVEDELSALRTLAAQADVLQAAVDAATDATARSASLYRNGLVPELELLDARRTELRVRRSALETRAARYTATVALVRALGGGWDAPSAPLAAR